MQEEFFDLQRQIAYEKKQVKKPEDCEVELRICFESVPKVVLTGVFELGVFRRGLRLVGSSCFQRRS